MHMPQKAIGDRKQADKRILRNKNIVLYREVALGKKRGSITEKLIEGIGKIVHFPLGSDALDKAFGQEVRPPRTSRHVMLRHVMLRHVTLRHVILRHVM